MEKKTEDQNTFIQLYYEVKALKLRAEELDEEFKTYYQPDIELLCALDHYMKFVKGPNENSIKKAIAHEYRAFFDAADWLAISLRKKIINNVKEYNNETITNVLPQYYREIKPETEKISEQISKIRNNKNADNGYNLEIIEKYRNELKKLVKYEEITSQCIPSMEEYKKKHKKENKQTWIKNKTADFIIKIGAGIALCIIVQKLLKWLCL